MAHHRRHGKMSPPKVRIGNEAVQMFEIDRFEHIDNQQKILNGEAFHVADTYKPFAANVPDVPSFDLPEFDVKFDKSGKILGIPQLADGTYKQVLQRKDHGVNVIQRLGQGDYKLTRVPDYCFFSAFGQGLSEEAVIDYCKNSDELMPGRQRSVEPGKSGFMANVALDKYGSKVLVFDADGLVPDAPYGTTNHIYDNELTSKHNIGEQVFVEKDALSRMNVHFRCGKLTGKLDDVRFSDIADKANEFQDKNGYVSTNVPAAGFDKATAYGIYTHDHKGAPCVRFDVLDKQRDYVYTYRVYPSDLREPNSRRGLGLHADGEKMRITLPHTQPIKAYRDDFGGKDEMTFGELAALSKANYLREYGKEHWRELRDARNTRRELVQQDRQAALDTLPALDDDGIDV